MAMQAQEVAALNQGERRRVKEMAIDMAVFCEMLKSDKKSFCVKVVDRWLPDDAVVVGVRAFGTAGRSSFLSEAFVVVWSASFDPVPEGQGLPLLDSPVLNRHQCAN